MDVQSSQGDAATNVPLEMAPGSPPLPVNESHSWQVAAGGLKATESNVFSTAGKNRERNSSIAEW